LRGVVLKNRRCLPPPRAADLGPTRRSSSIDTTRAPFIYGSEGATLEQRSVEAMLRFTMGLVVATAAFASVGFAHAQQPTDDSLRIYAVDIWQDPAQSWGPGRGVYLGRGLIITAAHVVTPVARTKPTVRIAGIDLPAKAIREGNVDRVDLTLLSIDERKLPIYLQMRRMALCDNNPWPGEPVIVAIPDRTARSHIMLPALLAPNVRERFSTVIREVGTSFNSGSGVFDAGQKCLLGIISGKIYAPANTPGAGSEDRDIAKYFVASSIIRVFIPAGYRF
jgi:hypothetical protein